MGRAGRGRTDRQIVLQRQNQLGQTLGAKGFETRRRLLAATSELLSTVPLTDLRVSQIVRLAQTSPGTFYVYFNDVYDVVLDLVGEVTQSPPKILDLFNEPWGGEGALRRAHEFVSMYLDHFQVHAALFRVRNLASDEGDMRFTRLRIAAVSPVIAAMAARIEARKAAGLLPVEIHPVSASGALLAMIERLAALRFSPATRVGSAQLVDVAAFFAALLLAEGPIVLDKARAARSPSVEDAALYAPDRSDRRPPRNPNVNLHGQTIGAKGAKTRQKLMETATQLLWEKPLLEISVNEIAKRSNTSTSVFWIYFRDVLDVVHAIVVDITQSTPDLLEILNSDWTAANRTELSERFVRRYIDNWRANRAPFRVRNMASDEGAVEFIQARHAAVEPLLEIIIRKLSARQAQGGEPLHLHPAAAAGGFMAMVERLSVTPHIGLSQEVTVDSVAKAAAYFLATLMAGPPPGAVVES